MTFEPQYDASAQTNVQDNGNEAMGDDLEDYFGS